MRKTESKASLRGRLTGDFIASLQAQWSEHGDSILDQLRTESPSKFAEIVARLCPAEHVVTQDDRFAGMSKEEVADVIVEGISRDLVTYEGFLRRARKLAAERQAAAPRETATEHRARIAREERARIPWSATN